MLSSSMRPVLVGLLLLACAPEPAPAEGEVAGRRGDDHAGAEEAEPIASADAVEVGADLSEAEGDDHDYEDASLPALRARLGEDQLRVEPFRGLGDVSRRCPAPSAALLAAERLPPEDDTYYSLFAPWSDECDLRPAAGYDAAGARWIVLDIDYSEGGPESFELAGVSPRRREVLLSDRFGPPGVERLRQATARFGALAAPDNLLSRRQAHVDFSLGSYPVLAALEAPLDGWLLYLETVADLDHPEHVLWLVAEDGHARHELGRREAALGPCDGGGYWCMRPSEHECDADGLRAEGRLCVPPLGVARVARGPDGSLLVTGTAAVAGHGGYPPFTWVVMLPDPLR